MFKTAFLWVLILHSFSLFSQNSNYTEVVDAAALLQKIEERNASVESIQSDFSQFKYLDVLEDEIESKGYFLFQKPDLMKWKYESPYAYTILRQGDEMKINDEGNIKTYDINSNPAFSAINTMMMNLITGNFFGSRTYQARFFENLDYYKVILKPEESLMKDFLNNITLFFKKGDFMLEQIQLNELSGDYTKIVFSDKILNAPLERKDFTIDQ